MSGSDARQTHVSSLKNEPESDRKDEINDSIH